MGSDFSMHNDCDKRQPLELTQTSIARTIYHTCVVLFALGINCKFKQYTLLDFFFFLLITSLLKKRIGIVRTISIKVTHSSLLTGNG